MSKPNQIIRYELDFWSPSPLRSRLNNGSVAAVLATLRISLFIASETRKFDTFNGRSQREGHPDQERSSGGKLGCQGHFLPLELS